MSRLSEWKSQNRLAAPLAEDRAESMWAIIQRKPDTITVIRDGVAQTAQTVRIEITSVSANEPKTDSGQAARRAVTIFGIQGHATLGDTDLRRGDRFKYLASGNLANYEVIAVDKVQIGKIEAIAEILD
jgi:hypothetical protein